MDHSSGGMPDTVASTAIGDAGSPPAAFASTILAAASFADLGRTERRNRA